MARAGLVETWTSPCVPQLRLCSVASAEPHTLLKAVPRSPQHTADCSQTGVTTRHCAAIDVKMHSVPQDMHAYQDDQQWHSVLQDMHAIQDDQQVLLLATHSLAA